MRYRYLFLSCLLFSLYTKLDGQNCSLVAFNVSASVGGADKPDTTVCKNSPLVLSANLPILRQPTGYTVAAIPFIDTLPCESVGTAVAGANINLDDKYSGVASLGFNFYFYNQLFSNLVICDNGFVTFSTNKAGLQGVSNVPFSGVTMPLSYTPTSTTYVPANIIMGAMFDMLTQTNLSPPGGGTISYQTVGNAPYRAFIVKYSDVRYYTPSCRANTSVRCNMKIVLYETTNMVDIYVKTKPICNGIQATQGILGTAMTQYVVSPGRNNTTWDGANTAYRYTPNGTNYSTSIQWTKNGTNLGTNPTQAITATDDSAFYIATVTVTSSSPPVNLTFRDSIKVYGWNNVNTRVNRNDTLICKDTMTLNATNTGVYSYKWNNGSTSPTRLINGVGSYWVIRTYDWLGCRKDSLFFNVIQFAKPRIDSIKRTGCFTPANTGSVLLYVSGDTAGIRSGLSLSSLNLGLTISNQGNGIKKYYVQNMRQCTDSFTTIHDSMAISYFKRNNYCTGDSSGLMRLSIVGGSPPLTYTLNGSSAQTKDSFNRLGTGIYTIQVVDKAGCSYAKTDTIRPPLVLTMGIVLDSVDCFGGSNGVITASFNGGQSPYTYSINGGALGSSNSFTGLTAGTYTIRGRDNVGCQVDSVVTLYQYSQIQIGKVEYDACPGIATGRYILSASGGNGGYMYRIDGGGFSVTNSYNAITAGIHSISVRDNNNCIRTITDTLGTRPKPVISVASIVHVSCFGGNNGSISTNVSGSANPFTYLWNTGNTTNAISSLSASSAYCLTVTDTFGCKDTLCRAIIQPSALALSANVYHPLCNNQSNGRLKLIATGGTTPYQYTINGGSYSSADSFPNLPSGTYTIQVRDANLCVTTSTRTLNNPTPLTITYVRDSVSCFGGSDGRIQITAAGGTPPYRYALNAAGFTSSGTFTLLSAWTYLTRTRDTNGCGIDSNIQVFQYPDISVSSSVVDTVRCRNGNDGKISATASGGLAPYTYAINGGSFQSSNVFSSLSPGNHVVQVRDAKNCIKNAASITLNNPAGMTSNVNIIRNVLCYGGNTAKARVAVSGGKTPYTYSWDLGGSLDSHTNLTAGQHWVITLDNNNCKDSAAFNITQPDTLRAGITLYHPKCYNQQGSIKISALGGVSPYNYSIGSGYQTMDSFSGLNFGNYTITIRDTNMCTRTYSRTLINPPLLTASYQVDSVKCFGGNDGKITITASGGTTPLTYKKNGSTMPSNIFSNLTIGVYQTQILDSNGCILDSNIAVYQYPVLTLTTTKIHIKCFGASTGGITTTGGGGNPNYMYSINGGSYSSSPNFSGLSAGIYQMGIRDANLCVATKSDTLVQRPAIVSSVQIMNNNCFGQNNGKVKILASGGTPPYQYQLNSGSYGSSDSFVGLTAGTYSYTVQDSNLCTQSSSFVISQPTRLGLTLKVDSVKCNKTVLGSIQVNPSGGTPSYQYSINNGAFGGTSLFSNLTIGNYYIQVRDANLCLKDTNMTLYATDSFYFGYVLDSITCYNQNNGRVTMTGYGGRTPYQYNMDAQVFTSSNVISNIPFGSHTMRIRDNYNCVLSAGFSLNNPIQIVTVMDSIVHNPCNQDALGAIYTQSTGGTGTLSLLWSNGKTTANITALVANKYTLTVTDSKGCIDTSSYSVTEPAAILINLAPANLKCYGDRDGKIIATVSGGAGGFSYLWSNSETTKDIIKLGPNSYTLTVTDMNNCTASKTDQIIEPDSLYYTLTKTNSSCIGSDNGSVQSVGIRGGTIPYAYQWSTNPGGNPTSINGLSPFQYYVLTVTDFNGCKRIDSAYIDTNYSLRFALSYIAPKCPRGLFDLQVNNLNGATPVQYSIRTKSTNTTGYFPSLYADTFTVYGVDNDGCTYSESFDAIPRDTMVTKLINYVPLCEAGNLWASKLNVSGGLTPYTYQWLGAYITMGDSAIHNQQGYFYVSVTDANNCTVKHRFGLFQADSNLQGVIVDKVNLRCYQVPEGGMRIYAKGGTPPYQYLWSTGETSPVVKSLAANTVYRVTISDKNNCKYEVEDSLIQPSKIEISTRVTHESCHNQDDGQIVVGATGGTAPNEKYQYAINGKDYTTRTYFPHLNAGVYVITAMDENLCKTSTDNILIETGNRIQLTIQPEYEVNLGDIMPIQLNVKVTPDTISNIRYEWTPSEMLSCSDCLDPVFNGYATQEFTLLAYHSNGCTDTGYTKVNVRRPDQDTIYLPTAFRPTSNDLQNQTYRAFGNRIAQFKIIIFNRIGEKVFESDDIQKGWDGNYKGEPSSVGVYTYHVEYRMLDNRRHSLSGSFTLLR